MKRKLIRWTTTTAVAAVMLTFTYNWQPPRWWPRVPKMGQFCMSTVMPEINWRILAARMISDTTKRAVEFYWLTQANAGLLQIDGADSTFTSFDEVLYEVTVRADVDTLFRSVGLSRNNCGRWSKGIANQAYFAKVRPWGIIDIDTFRGVYEDSIAFIFPSAIDVVTTFLPMGIIRVDTVITPDTIGG